MNYDFLIKPFILDNYRFTCSCRNDTEGAHVPSAQFPPLVSLSKLWDKTTTRILPPMLATHKAFPSLQGSLMILVLHFYSGWF